MYGPGGSVAGGAGVSGGFYPVFFTQNQVQTDEATASPHGFAPPPPPIQGGNPHGVSIANYYNQQQAIQLQPGGAGAMTYSPVPGAGIPPVWMQQQQQQQHMQAGRGQSVAMPQMTYGGPQQLMYVPIGAPYGMQGYVGSSANTFTAHQQGHPQASIPVSFMPPQSALLPATSSSLHAGAVVPAVHSTEAKPSQTAQPVPPVAAANSTFAAPTHQQYPGSNAPQQASVAVPLEYMMLSLTPNTLLPSGTPFLPPGVSPSEEYSKPSRSTHAKQPQVQATSGLSSS